MSSRYIKSKAERFSSVRNGPNGLESSSNRRHHTKNYGNSPEQRTQDDYVSLEDIEDGSSYEMISDTGLTATCIQVYGEKAQGNEALRSPTGVAQLLDESVIVCDTFNDRVIKYSPEGRLERIFNGSPPLSKPSAVALVPCCHADMNAFAVKDHHDVVIFDSQCKQLKSLARGNLHRPYGLTLDEDKSILITVETGHRNGRTTITKISPIDGELIRVEFRLTEHSGPASKPRFIAHLKDDILVIVDLGLDLLAMVSTDTGAILRKFGRCGTGPSEFRDPSGVVCDADGLIVVGDSRNHRLQVFSPEGKFLSYLKVDRKLNRPSGLYLTPCSHLFVINYWENCVVKYKISQV